MEDWRISRCLQRHRSKHEMHTRLTCVCKPSIPLRHFAGLQVGFASAGTADREQQSGVYVSLTWHHMCCTSKTATGARAIARRPCLATRRSGLATCPTLDSAMIIDFRSERGDNARDCTQALAAPLIAWPTRQHRANAVEAEERQGMYVATQMLRA
jgi:hypothetical protein